MQIRMNHPLPLLIFLIAYVSCAVKRPLLYQLRQVRNANYSDDVVKASNSLGFALLQEVPSSGNVFISPFSISLVMGMVYLGAKNQTAAEMEKVLGYKYARVQQENVPVGHKKATEILKLATISKSKDVIDMEIANAMLVDDNFDLVPSFKEKGRYFYDAVVESVSFSSQGEFTLNSINGWTAWKTRNKIPQILQEPLDPLTKVFLMNAIYFKGTWKIKFDQRLTMPDTFYNNGKIPTTVPMMRQKKKFNFGVINSIKSSVLELPYEGDQFTMLLLLPEKRDGLPELESSLTRAMVDNLSKSLREVTVQVTLPRFSLEEDYDMIKIFKKMGLRSLFSAERADLSGISPTKGLHVTKIVHKSIIDVNEEGSEAAAVTGVSAGVRTGGPLHPLFTADHPFIFFVRDRHTNAILFIGRVNNL